MSINDELLRACLNWDFSEVKTLIKKGADVNVKGKWGTPLQLFLKEGDYRSKEEFEFLVKNGADLNVSLDDNEQYCTLTYKTPLHLACKLGSKFIVEEILKNKIFDINVKNKYGKTPLHIACENENTEIVELLLENNADVEVKYDSETPLHLAAGKGNQKIAELLINAGADVNAKDEDDNTPLILAAWNGYQHKYKEVVELLIAKGADINSENNEGKTPLMLAKEHNYEHLIQVLNQHGAKVSVGLKKKESSIPLEEIISKVTEFEAICNNPQCPKNTTPLHCAVDQEGYGKTEFAEYLINNGANINAQNEFGNTPLIVAAKAGIPTCVDLLIKKGAELNLQTNKGDTALHWAAKNGDSQILKLLLEAGLDPKIKNFDNKTAYDLANDEYNKSQLFGYQMALELLEKYPH